MATVKHKRYAREIDIPTVGLNPGEFIAALDTRRIFFCWSATERDFVGLMGPTGDSPHIGENGNWYIGDTDTGVKAQGEDGNPADLIHNTYFAWRDAPGAGFTLVDNLHSAYEAMLVTHEVLNPPVESNFDGLWRARLTESSADKYYRHEQNIPSAVWSINHRLLKYPSVSILDTGGNTVEANINHIDNQNLILTFSAPFTGFADLN